MPLPIITVAQMREWEQATWATGQSEDAVIARVGEIVARRALDMTRPGARVLILAGKGHNGDDARQAVRFLADRKAELIEAQEPGAALAPITEALARLPALVIDGLFGIGLNRPLDSEWTRLIGALNEARRPVLAVDNPSGLNVETGTPEPTAIAATLTLTLGAPKRGLFTPAALPYVGRLEVAPDIGLTPCPIKSDWEWTMGADFAEFPPPRPAGGHKGTFGHVAIVAGSLGYHGAAVLAARGAQRAQPGLVTLLPQEDVFQPVAAQLQAVMVRPFDPDHIFEPYTAILCGPGLASANLPAASHRMVERLWLRAEQPVIVDASALDWLPPREAGPPQAIRVITPHPGEAARLLNCSVADVQRNRPQALRELSQTFGGCWVILKGHQTLIGRSEGELIVNSSGNPALAQGGAGDVLAGYLAGLLAQPSLQTLVPTTLRYAVWQHGAAADALSRERANWIVEELLPRLGATAWFDSTA
jgi:ADP-dependent NAD(P)H-hydrate dehydratase / NAD(P)H-hydrate epimerase